MELDFQGFQTIFPIWVYLLVALGSVALAWWSYKDMRSIRPLFRGLLIGLRSAVFVILVLLLLNPVFRQTTTHLERPGVMVMLDRSESTSITKGGYQGQESYQSVLDALQLSDTAKADLDLYSFAGNFGPVDPDTMQLNGNETQLYEVMDWLRQHQDRYQAAVLVSDGIYTLGRDPAFLARQIGVPVFTVGLGDTSRVKDIIVQNVSADEVGYTQTTTPVEVTIRTNGFGGQSIPVELRSNQDVVARKNVEPESGEWVTTFSFDLPLKEEGLHQYRIHVPEQPDEWSASNNTRIFSVDVQNNKRRIVHVSFDIHPDVKTVRSILGTDRHIALTTRTWLGGDRFIEGGIPAPADSIDLLITQGYPAPDIPTEVRQKLNQLIESTPTLVLALPDFNPVLFSDSVPFEYPIEPQQRTGLMDIQLRPVAERSDHPVMELPTVNFGSLPPLYAPIRQLSTSSGSQVLFRATYHGNETDAPVLALREVGNKRIAQLNAFGIYRWYQSNDQNVRKWVRQLVSHLVDWTITQPDTRLLKVEPTQQVFDGDEAVKLQAFLTNESGQPETQGVINVRLEGDQVSSRTYTMEHQGEGRYTLNVGSLPEGMYQFEATARKGERSIDHRKGEFSVAPTNVEYVNTRRNDALLQQIAAQSGGEAVTFQQAGRIRDLLNDGDRLEARQRTETTTFHLYRHWFWFALVLLLLSGEWFLRKYVALP